MLGWLFDGHNNQFAHGDLAMMINIGRHLHEVGKIEEAVFCLNRVLELRPHHPQAEFFRSMCFLQAAQWSRGWDGYEARINSHPIMSRSNRMIEPTPQAFVGRDVIIYGEQGVGDEIMFASCIPDVIERAKSVTLFVDDRLVSLFKRSFSSAEVFPRGRVQPGECNPHVREVLMGSLPRAFRRDDDSFANTALGYLTTDESLHTRYNALLSGGGHLNVGVCWRGGTASTRDNLRSIPYSQFVRELMEPFPLVNFWSLQHDQRRDREDDLEREHEPTPMDELLPPSLYVWTDFDRLAAFIGALDLVITVQCSIVHLCGALGVPCVALISDAPEWRYGDVARSMPWYATVRLLRQSRLAHWDDVLKSARGEIVTELRNKNTLEDTVLSRAADRNR